jgi:nucleotide-binding universal stress UspA family protein
MRVSLKRFLCTTDLSDLSNQAVTYANALAKEFGAKLYICHVVDLPTAAMYGEAVLFSAEQQERNVAYAEAYIRKSLQDTSAQWEPVVVVGHTVTEVARLVEDMNIDLAISASHGRSGLKRLILGSVTERLMQTLSCPLMVVRGTENQSKADDDRIKMRRILVGCDFSPESDLAFQYSLSLAQEFESELHLVHVIEPPLYKDLLKPAVAEGVGLQQDLRETIGNKLSDMVPEDSRHWCTPKTSILAGQPHEELIKYVAVHDIDLIALGVRGQSMAEKIFVGSTTDRVARRATCPVLSVLP